MKDGGEVFLTDNERNLVENNERLVYVAWSRLKDNWIKASYRDDLIEAGYEGLCRAARIFNPEKGKFSTIAIKCIEMQMYKELNLINKRVVRVIELDHPVRTPRHVPDGVLTLGDCIESIDDEVENALDNLAEREIIRSLAKLLTVDEQNLLLEYARGSTYAQIGAQRNITRARVGQLIKRIRNKVLSVHN